MAGIAGIAEAARVPIVESMLGIIAHRGSEGREICEVDGATFGIVWTASQESSVERLVREKGVSDQAESGHCALARMTDDGLLLRRDPLGVAPLYYGKVGEDTLCFASEVKALLDHCTDIKQLPAGHEL